MLRLFYLDTYKIIISDKLFVLKFELKLEYVAYKLFSQINIIGKLFTTE